MRVEPSVAGPSAVELKTSTQATEGSTSTGPKALAVSSGYSQEGGTKRTGVEGNTRSASAVLSRWWVQ